MEAITSVTGDAFPMGEANKVFKAKINWTKTNIYVYAYVSHFCTYCAHYVSVIY